MKNRRLKALFVAATLIVILGKGHLAQDSANQPRVPSQNAAQIPVEPSQTTRVKERHYGRLKINVGRGVSVMLGNRTTGRITINGWDRDVIEARAVSERGDEIVILGRSNDSENARLFLKADYADLDQPAEPTSQVYSPPQVQGGSLKVHLEINLPRYSAIELIQVWRSDVQVNGVATPVMVSGDRSSVILNRVGAATVQTRSGNVEIEDANGPVEVATTSGAVRVHNAKGPVRVVSIAGPIEIKCARGRIDVTNTEAPIELVNTNGDVEAIATNSSVRISGKLRDDGKYNLRSLSGRVEMILPSDSHGFDATLSSYRGIVETDFKLDATQLASHGVQKGRLVGRFGNGKAQVTLDSFDGLVRLTKINPASLPGCN